ncbi:MAG: NUDIX domain-containing protein [Fibromonadaceae bacterium]|jgi:isopentenyldiphosphate isomerase|nr:NUDIX domain-containing protein [Fibromonadaceae bacterium]
MEKVKVFNANLRELGIEDRDKVHKEGLWHKTFHCWLVSDVNGGSLLFQLRSKEKKNYPNMLDISAAGHLIDDEDDADGIREVKEELGLDIQYENLHSLGYRVEVDDAENGQKNREYQSIYLAKIDNNLSQFKPQIDEVSGLVWLKIADALLLFDGKQSSAIVEGIFYNKGTSNWEAINRSISISDFIPRIQKYYLAISIMADRLLKKQFPLAIS